jgi:hypothetical protein
MFGLSLPWLSTSQVGSGPWVSIEPPVTMGNLPKQPNQRMVPPPNQLGLDEFQKKNRGKRNLNKHE